MKGFCLFFIFLSMPLLPANAQDRLVLKDGSEVEVHIQNVDGEGVEYMYSNRRGIYECPKSQIAYIQYANGEKIHFDGDKVAASAVVTLRNGKQLKGEIVSEDDDYLRLRTENGRISILQRNIANVTRQRVRPQNENISHRYKRQNP